jgi:hypothetical protein
MKIQTVLAIFITLVRIYLSIKIISWLILNLISEVPHPIEEIQNHLIVVLLDTWFSNQINNIVISEVKED